MFIFAVFGDSSPAATAGVCVGLFMVRPPVPAAAGPGARASPCRRPRTWSLTLGRLPACRVAVRLPPPCAAARTCFDQLLMQGLLQLVRPFAQADEVMLQPLDGVAQRPALGLVGRAVAGGIVAGRVAFGAIGEMLDHRRRQGWRAPVPPPTRWRRRRPGSRCRRPAAPEGRSRWRARRRGVLAAGDALERGDRPLVVDDVEDHRRAVDRGEGQGVVEVGLGRGPVADPGRRRSGRRPCRPRPWPSPPPG